MQEKPAKVVPFYSTLMSLGLMLFLATVVTVPDGELHFFGLYWPITWLMEMTSVALFVFGFVFGLLAAISARRAHIQRMKDAAAEAAAGDASVSESRTETNAATPTATAIPDALFTTPEPRVMVLDNVVKPNLEFPTFSKA